MIVFLFVFFFVFLVFREEEMQQLNRSTNAKMATFSLLSLGVCLSVAGLQLWHLKTFFERKKLLWFFSSHINSLPCSILWYILKFLLASFIFFFNFLKIYFANRCYRLCCICRTVVSSEEHSQLKIWSKIIERKCAHDNIFSLTNHLYFFKHWTKIFLSIWCILLLFNSWIILCIW